MNRVTLALAALALVGGGAGARAQGGPPHMPGYYSGEPNVDPPWYGTGPGWIPSDGFNGLIALGPPPTDHAPQPSPEGTGPHARHWNNGY
jgi:hypothetical protein